MSSRAAFLQQAGWPTAAFEPVGEDWSIRKFYRLKKGERSAILIESLPDTDPNAPSGHLLGDFVRIAEKLRGIGLSVPEIYAADPATGFLLTEDFGATSFRDVLDKKFLPQQQLYMLATDVLVRLHEQGQGITDVPDYFQSYVHKGRRRLVDWYMPIALSRPNPAGLVDDYMDVWDEIMNTLPVPQKGFQHIDFHLQNLLWLPGREGIAQCGVIDFQGGMHGPVPYDLANLLDDIRVLVPENIRAPCLERFLHAVPAGDREALQGWYDVLAAQFHSRILGQVYKLALVANKTRLLKYMPIVTDHFKRGLKKPILKPLKNWLEKQGVIDLIIPDFDPEKARAVIAKDAF